MIAATLSLIFALTAFAMEKTVTSNSMTSNPNNTAKTDYIVLGMGCFWGAEKRMSEIPGVLDVESGYAGGDLPGMGYQQILNHERMLSAGRTTARNHAEVIKVTFDPAKVTLETVLAKFWENHNPTQGDRQGNDIGSQYRSEIFTTTAAQASTAAEVKALVAASGTWRKPIVTRIEPATTFVRAEEYHQDYLVKHPDGYNDHFLRPFDF